MILSAFNFGGDISFSKQWPLYESLRTTAGIIFGVMGVWIALIYPDTLAKVLDKDQQNKEDEINKLRKVLEPLIMATIILLLVLLIGVFVPILKQFDILIEYVVFLRMASFFILLSSTFLMGWLLVKAIIPGVEIKQGLENHRRKQDVLERVKRKIRTQK